MHEKLEKESLLRKDGNLNFRQPMQIIFFILDNSIMFENFSSEIKFIKILSCVGPHILQQQQVDGA